VNWIVAGLDRSKRYLTEHHREFYSVSYKEQKPVEHVNNFMKDCKSLSSKFMQGTEWLAGCVMIAAGLYNFKKARGYFTRNLH
jgi:menaquinone-dependent protoporphyrinogen IX oxidase